MEEREEEEVGEIWRGKQRERDRDRAGAQAHIRKPTRGKNSFMSGT